MINTTFSLGDQRLNKVVLWVNTSWPTRCKTTGVFRAERRFTREGFNLASVHVCVKKIPRKDIQWDIDPPVQAFGARAKLWGLRSRMRPHFRLRMNAFTSANSCGFRMRFIGGMGEIGVAV